MGPPGSGKGTVCESLECPNINHISTGDLLRADPTFTELINKGHYVPCDYINNIVSEKVLANKGNENILDGYPRTVQQVEFLYKNEIKIKKVIYLSISLEDVKERILKRGRNDDTLEALKNRFKEFKDKTEQLLEEFKKRNVEIIKVDANRCRDEVMKDVKKAIMQK